MSFWVEVAFPIPLSQTYTYALPEQLGEAVVGQRVLVPFRNRKTTGFIFQKSQTAPSIATKEVLDLLDPEALLTPTQLKLIGHLQKSYSFSLGECLAAVMPAGLMSQSRQKIRRPSQAEPQQHDPSTKTAKPASALEPEAQTLLDQFSPDKSYDHGHFVRRSSPEDRRLLKSLIKLGHLELHLGHQSERAKAISHKTYHIVENILPMLRGPRQKQLFDLLKANQGSYAEAELKAQHPELLATCKNLEKRSLILVTEHLDQLQPESQTFDEAPEHALNTQQSIAVNALKQAIEAESFARFLLFGPTGSGKTEVYLHAAKAAQSRGKTVLALVPEIALTPQFVGRFRARFGSRIAILHSGLSESERLTQWQRIANGEAQLVIGVRSAIFAPLNNIGLIILDEEHDASYKQSEGLRYNAKDLANYLASHYQAPLVLGSATPSLEQFHSAQNQSCQSLFLEARAGKAQMADVELVDVKEELGKFGQKGLICEKLRNEMEICLSKNEQVILFLNRRGYAPLVLCPKCGGHQKCPNCSICLTYHQSDRSHRCHYCDYVQSSPHMCSTCHHDTLLHLGMGTQALEEEVENYFPDIRVGRMDRDSVTRKRGHEKILSSFARGEIDVLVGTQMLSKGIDFPNVTLVGVILAEQALHQPDFRAAENCFQLLTQVVGRSGRGQKRGKAVLQSFQPDHYAVQAAAKQDYRAFYAQEIEFRKELAYPPFSHLALFEFSSSQEASSTAAANWLAKQLRANFPQADGLSILGPAPAPISKLRGKHRQHLLIKTESEEQRHRMGSWAFQLARPILEKQKVKLILDINPYSFM